jgi:hypothetical protein
MRALGVEREGQWPDEWIEPHAMAVSSAASWRNAAVEFRSATH